MSDRQIDALGVPSMFGAAAEIESRDPLAGDAIVVRVAASGRATWSPQGGALVVAASHTARGPSSSTGCRFINFFASEERARRYLAVRPLLGGRVLSIPEAIEAGRSVFGGLLEAEPRSVAAL